MFPRSAGVELSCMEGAGTSFRHFFSSRKGRGERKMGEGEMGGSIEALFHNLVQTVRPAVSISLDQFQLHI